MSRVKIVAGNWKMNKNYNEGLELISEALYMVKDELHKEVKTIFCPPYIHLSSIAKLVNAEHNCFVASQNCHQEKSGAYTGEISCDMIRSVGASYVIIGHSERRAYFHEDEKLLARKVDAALAQDLSPIFCIGELLEEREKNIQIVRISTESLLQHHPPNILLPLLTPILQRLLQCSLQRLRINLAAPGRLGEVFSSRFY